jgi:voltage-gated potassium channel
VDAVRRLRQIEWLLLAVGVTLGAGTVGFRLILHEPWLQSLYRAVITATLTGLGTVPSSNGARLLSIGMIIAGLTIIAYAGAVIVEAIAGGVLTGAVAERRRERTIEKLNDHFIICGYGRVGRRVADEFRAAGVPYVVIDFREESVGAAKEHGDLFIEGDATKDEDLQHAGLDRAKGLVAVTTVRHETGAIIVALRKRDGTFDTTPEPDVTIDPGDVIVGVGTTDELQRLEDLFAVAT